MKTNKLPVNPTAVDTDKYPVRDGRPGRVLGSTVETDLIALSGAQSLKYLHNIRLRRSRHDDQDGNICNVIL